MQLDSINKEPLLNRPVEQPQEHVADKTAKSHNPLVAKMIDGLAKVSNVYHKLALKVINLISPCKNSLSRLASRLVDKSPVARQPAPSDTISPTHAEKLRLALHKTIDPRALLSSLTQNGHTDVNGKAFMAFFSQYPEHPSFNSSNIIIKDNRLVFKTPLDTSEKATEGVNIKELHIDGNVAMADDFGNLLARLYILDETKQFKNLQDLCQQLTADDKHSYVKVRASQDLAVLMNGKDQQSAANLYERYADYFNELIEPRQQGDKVIYSPVLAARQFDDVRKDIAFFQVLSNIDAEFGAVAANNSAPVSPATRSSDNSAPASPGTRSSENSAPALPKTSPPDASALGRITSMDGMLPAGERILAIISPEQMNQPVRKPGAKPPVAPALSERSSPRQQESSAPRQTQTGTVADIRKFFESL